MDDRTEAQVPLAGSDHTASKGLACPPTLQRTTDDSTEALRSRVPACLHGNPYQP